MASKKLQNNIDSGLWAYYGHPNDDYIASVYPLENDIGFTIAFHKGEMPEFAGESFETLDELEARMRELEPDMRKWKVRA